MNNKELGNKFEDFMCDYLKQQGWWAHFISPDRRGAQPFDIIAVKDGVPVAIDCKTSEDHIFRLGRLEDNQKTAFDLWLKRGNIHAFIAVYHENHVYFIDYEGLKEQKRIDLNDKKPIIDYEVEL